MDLVSENKVELYTIYYFISAIYGLLSYTTWGAVVILSEKNTTTSQIYVFLIITGSWTCDRFEFLLHLLMILMNKI